jgi:hypothetical protein
MCAVIIAAADQILGAHARSDPVGVRLDGDAKPHQSVVLAVPARRFLFELRQGVVEAERMARVARRLAAQLLGVDLADAKLGLRLDRGGDQFGRRCRHRMIERAGGAGREHLHAGQIIRKAHRRSVEVKRQRQQDVAHPIFEQQPVGDTLEQGVPVMLVHVDEAGHDDRAGGVDHLIESIGRRTPGRRAYGGNSGTVGGHEAAGMDLPLRVDRCDISVFDQCPGHRRAALLRSEPSSMTHVRSRR